MFPQKELISQYRAGLKMLEASIDKCPDELWADTSYQNVYWQIVYHALHYTALYLAKDEASFVPWKSHKPGIHQLGAARDVSPNPGTSYSKFAMKEYTNKLFASLEREVNEQSLEDISGFDWLPLNKLELHLYNIRHLQHHTGQLIERLHQVGIHGIGWVRQA